MSVSFGYARVSSIDQNADRQLIAVLDKGVALEQIYIDKQSGKNFGRPRYKALLEQLKKGDLALIDSEETMRKFKYSGGY